MYAEGRTVDKDEAKAAELFEKGCKYNDPRGCTAFAMALVSGTGVTKHETKAAEFFDKACERDDPSGCTNLGFMYAIGQGVKKDEPKALELFQKACDGGNTTGCKNILGYHAAACERGEAQSCLEGGRWVQAMLEKESLPTGLQLDQNAVSSFLAEAARLLELGCNEEKAQSCAALASLYSKGEGVGQDQAKAAELDKRACELGLTAACAQR
jgi:TPR repeat protein